MTSGASIDLSFLNGGKDLAFSLSQLKAMDSELEQIAAQSPAIIALANSFGLTYTAASKLTKELQLAPGALSSAVSIMGQLKAVGADAVTQYAVLGKQLGLSADQMKLLTGEVEALGGKKDAVVGLSQAISQLFILDKINAFKAAIFSAGAEFERLNTRLRTTLGTQEAATAAFANIERFAATTPFQLGEVTDAFVKLKQRGIEPSNKALTNLGDLASSQGKSLNQTTEAILDAQQGEFERLKEFGIKASAAGDKVNLSFQGVNRQIERTPESISAGILALGAMEGVAGGMALQAATLEGATSNLTDSTQKLAKEAFALVVPVALELTKAATSLISGFYELPDPIQKAILLTGLLGGAFASAVVAMAAFKAAGIGVALVEGQKSIAMLPNLLLTTAQSAANTLAALSEVTLTGTKASSTAASGAKATALGVEAAATAANTAATSAATAATVAGTTATVGGTAAAATFGAIAGAVLAAVAVSATLVGATFLSMTQQEAAAEKSSEGLAKNYEAVATATVKREAASKAAAAVELVSSETARKSKLSLAQQDAEYAANNSKYEADFAASIQGRISWLDRVLDAMRDIANLPAELFSRTFELIAKLPAPKIVQDFFSGVAEQFNQFKLKTSGKSLIEDDAIARGKDAEEAFAVTERTNRLKAKAGGLGNLSKGEIEPQIKAYEEVVSRLEKATPKDASAAQDRDKTVASLKKQQAELEQANKLIREREKRVASAGTAEVQFAAEVKKTSENIGKQIASSEDANKQIENTKKQLEGGFISADQAKLQFEQVAAYTSATGDVQISAAKELRAIRDKELDFKSGALESQIQQAELAGAQEIKTAEETVAAVARIKVQQSDLEIQKIRAIIDEEVNAGRTKGEVYRKAVKDQEQALTGQKRAVADSTSADKREAVAKVNKAITDSQRASSDAETKGTTDSKKAVLAALQSGNADIEQAERDADKKRLEARRTALAAEVVLKQSKISELNAVGSKEAKEQAKSLSSDVLKLQQQQVDTEIEIVKKAQKQKLDDIADAQAKRKAIVGKDSANAETSIAAAELAAVKNSELSKSEIKEQASQSRLSAQAASLGKEQQLLTQQLGDVRKSQADGLISKKDADKQVVQLETDIAGKRTAVIQNQLAQVEALESKRLRILQESIAKQRALADSAKATSELSDARNSLADVQENELSKEDIANKSAIRKEASAKRSAAIGVDLLQQELSATQQAINDGVINRKDGALKVLELQTQLSRASVAQVEAESGAIVAARERQQKEVEDVINRAKASAAAEQAGNAASADLEIAQVRLSTAGAVGERLQELDKKVAAKRQELAVKAAEASVKSAGIELDGVEKLIEAGVINRKDAETKKAEAVAASTKAQADLVAAQAELEIGTATRVREAKLKLIADELRAKQAAANESLSLIQEEQALISQSQSLSSAQQGLFSAQKAQREQSRSLATQELDIAKQFADANGNKALSDQYALQIKQLELQATKAQRAELEAQFAAKAQGLALDVESKRLASEQLVIEKELALLDAQSAVNSAVLEGKSKGEIDLLKQKATASERSLEIANKASANQERIFGLQQQSLALERANDLNANAGAQRKAAADIGLEQARQQKGDGKTGGQTNFGPSRESVSAFVTAAPTAVLATEGAATAADALGKSLADAAEPLANFVKLLKVGTGTELSVPRRGELSGARADGGPVAAGGAYLVGERGPEIVRFGQAGQVFSNADSAAMVRSFAQSLSAAASLPATQSTTEQTTSSPELLKELRTLNNLVRSAPAPGDMTVPITVVKSDLDGAAEALQVLRASRAAQYRMPLR